MAQVFCGSLAAVLATFFDVDKLSEILSIGIMMAYAVVCAAVIVLRFNGLPPETLASTATADTAAARTSSFTSLQDELNPRKPA